MYIRIPYNIRLKDYFGEMNRHFKYGRCTAIFNIFVMGLDARDKRCK